MKKLIIALILFMACFQFSQAQSNPGFSYQAVARDAMGQPMNNEKLDLRFTVIKDDTGVGNGTIVYRERHQPTTNEYGLFDLVVGKGDSLYGDFHQIDWSQSNLFLQVDIDLNGNSQFSFMGKSRILPVPLALHAMSAENVDDADANPSNEIQMLSLSGDNLSISGANGVDLSGLSKDDADANPQNELQQLNYDANSKTLQLSQNGGSVDLSGLASTGQGGNNQTLSLNGNALSISDGNSVNLDSLASPWERKAGYIQYLNGPIRVDELYAEREDSVVYLNKDRLYFDDNKAIIGDETILDHDGLHAYSGVNSFVSVTPDSLRFDFTPLGGNNQFTKLAAAELSLRDTSEVARLSPNALQFDFTENTGDYAYYGHDSLAFAYNFNFLTPFFSNMDALKLSFWSPGGESKHWAAYSEYLIADRKVEIDGIGIVGKGESGGTQYDQFRLESGEFTMRNDVRFTALDFKAIPNSNAFAFNMYPGTGLPAYVTLGPAPNDPLSAQLTLQSQDHTNVELNAEGEAGNFTLFDHGKLSMSLTGNSLLGGSELMLFDSTELISMGMRVDFDNRPNLWLYDGNIELFDANGNLLVETNSEGAAGRQTFYGSNNLANVQIGSFGNVDRGIVSVNDEGGNGRATLSIVDNGGALVVSKSNDEPGVNAFINADNKSEVDIFDGYLRMYDSRRFTSMEVRSTNGLGELSIFGENGNSNFEVTNGFTSANHGLVNINNEAGTPQVSFASTANGGAIRMSRPNANFAVDAYVDGSNLAHLDVFGGTLGVRTLNNTAAVEASSVNGIGELRLYGDNGNTNFEVTNGFTSANHALVNVNDDAGTPQVAFAATANGGAIRMSRPNANFAVDAYVDGSNQAHLDVFGGTLGVRTLSNTAAVEAKSSNGYGELSIYGANGNLNMRISANGGGNRPSMEFFDEFGSLRGGFLIDNSGNGQFFADTKHFRIDHPKDPEKEIWYVSLEGPEAAAYERGTADLEGGEAFIPFPEHYQLVANAATMTVQVTPLSADSKGLAVVKKTEKGFYVKELFQGTGSYEFDWEVKAVRKGHENFQPVRDKK